MFLRDPATATSRGHQGRISRSVRARLSGQIKKINRVERLPALLIGIDNYSGRLCFLDQYSKTCGQSASDPVELAIALLLLAQLVPPFIRGILTVEEGGCPQTITELYEMAQDPDSFLRIPADGEIICERELDPCIVADPLPIPVQIFLAAENDPLVQQIAVVHRFTAVITPACFYAAGRQKTGPAGTGNPIDPRILPALDKVEFQDLFNPWRKRRNGGLSRSLTI